MLSDTIAKSKKGRGSALLSFKNVSGWYRTGREIEEDRDDGCRKGWSRGEGNGREKGVDETGFEFVVCWMSYILIKSNNQAESRESALYHLVQLRRARDPWTELEGGRRNALYAVIPSSSKVFLVWRDG